MGDKAIGVALILAAGISAASASAEEKLTLATYLPPTHFAITEGITPFMDCVSSETGGEITFDFFTSGQIASAAESLSAINDGLADISYLIPQQLSSRMPLSNIPLMPNMGDTAGEIVASYRKALAADGLLAGELRANGLVLIMVNQYAPYQVAFTKGRVETMAGFRGLKLRVIGGSATGTALNLGAVPVELPAGDVYVALQRGTIDGVFYPAAGMMTYALNEVTKAASSNGNFGGSMAMIAMDEGAFNTLPQEQQDIVIACGLSAEERLTTYQDQQQKAALTELAEAGVDIFEFPPEELEKINAALAGVAEEFAERLDKRGLPGREVLDEFLTAAGRR